MGDDSTELTDAGFSLIELLIVILVLGILATVVVFSVRGITDNGQDSACETDQRTLATAVESYLAQNTGGVIPATGGSVEQTLINAELIREQSDYWEVQTDGSIIEVSPC